MWLAFQVRYHVALVMNKRNMNKLNSIMLLIQIDWRENQSELFRHALGRSGTWNAKKKRKIPIARYLQ